MATSQAQQISTTTADATPEKGAIEQLYTEAPASGLEQFSIQLGVA
jgi:hypothetical protein